MSNAFIFYRTLATPKSNPTYADPNNLPAGQKLLFTPPNNLASKIDEDYTNNIVRKIPPNPAGRRINQTDEGVAGWLITIEGNFIKGSAGADTKVHAFRILPQSDATHVFGIFGIQWPNGPAQLRDMDPIPTKGLMIENVRGTHVGITKEIVDFAIRFSYGGDVT
jgi:hypothetical protein